MATAGGLAAEILPPADRSRYGKARILVLGERYIGQRRSRSDVVLARDIFTSAVRTSNGVARRRCHVFCSDLRKQMMTTLRFMERYRVASTRAWIVCAAIATSGLGCGGEVEPAVAASPPAATTATAGGPWTNQPFTEQTQIFHPVFAATPSASSIDAVVGLSDGPAADFTDLAAIVRFNPDGTIDVRSGPARARLPVPHRAGGRGAPE
ncbi:MAG TPA: hypothetical protein VF516_07130 [Kofleriaceae bacterium]